MINCALVYGFDSPEHDVSVMTALEIMRNAPSKGIRLKPVYARDGRFFGGDELSEIKAYTPFEAGKHPEVFVQSGRLWRVKRGKARAECELDCALIAAHGGAGENGALQGLLEVSGVKYLSTGVFGAAQMEFQSVRAGFEVGDQYRSFTGFPDSRQNLAVVIAGFGLHPLAATGDPGERLQRVE